MWPFRKSSLLGAPVNLYKPLTRLIEKRYQATKLASLLNRAAQESIKQNNHSSRKPHFQEVFTTQ